MDVRSQTEQLEIISNSPSAEITVAAGLNGRRGSYYFVAAGINPNSMTDAEITSHPDIKPLIYDIYLSTSTAQQWQLRVGIDGYNHWFPFIQTSLGGAVSYLENIDINALAGNTAQIIHNLDTFNVITTVYATNAPRVDVGAYVERVDTNTINVKLLESLDGITEYTVLVVGIPTSML